MRFLLVVLSIGSNWDNSTVAIFVVDVYLIFAWLSSLQYSMNVAGCCVLPTLTKILSFFWKRFNDVVDAAVVADAVDMVSLWNGMLNPERPESIVI